MGYHRAGFEVVGVDIEPQPNYPFEFWQADAIEFMRRPKWWMGHVGINSFDAIHASPPCQAYSTITPDHSKHPDLVAPVRELLKCTGLPYVIENVVGAPLLTGFILCGSMFGLRVRRHRLFESNVLIMPPTCDHAVQGVPVGVYGDGGGTAVLRPSGTSRGIKAKPSEFSDLMEMPWATPKEIVQAIPPVYAEFIGSQLLNHITAKAAS
jgi:DNA (cytosine-5)-methyltransferase 1